MFVKMLDGPFAGELKDLRSDVGLEFIRQGRAERAFMDPTPAIVEGDLVVGRSSAAKAPAKAGKKKPDK